MGKDPGETLRTAKSLPIALTRRTVTDSLGINDAIDIWKITTRVRSSLNLTLNGLAKKANADVYLLNASGRLINSLTKRGNKPETFSQLPLAAGTYYLRIQLQNRKASTPYRLSLSAQPTQDQFGNFFDTATPLTSASGRTTDFVGNSDTNDFLKFGTLIAGKLNFQLTGLSDDANLELYDSNRKLIAASSTLGTANETINQRLTGIAGSTYYVRIAPAAGKDVNYSLNYSFVADTPVTTASGLKYIDIASGTGNTPQQGQTVTVQYTGILTNGTQFDSSRDRNTPFSFKIGLGQVISGWDEGIRTMKVGGRRQLIIPPSLGYGSSGAGSAIPPNATLIFDVEVLSIS